MAELKDRVARYLSHPGRPAGVRFWRRKQRSYLTLSLIIAQSDPVAAAALVQLQDRIKANLGYPCVVDNPEAQDADCLFRYPTESLHCSLVNFLTSRQDFDVFSTKSGVREHLTHLIVKHVERAGLGPAQALIGGLYPGSTSAPIDSFSLQLFPEDEFVEAIGRIAASASNDRLFRNAVSLLPDCCSRVTVKGYPPAGGGNIERFPVNILRFMHKAGSGECVNTGQEHIKDEVLEFNRSYQVGGRIPIRLSIDRLALVEPDPFLFGWKSLREFNLRIRPGGGDAAD
jgi:hypothetical protein